MNYEHRRAALMLAVRASRVVDAPVAAAAAGCVCLGSVLLLESLRSGAVEASAPDDAMTAAAAPANPRGSASRCCDAAMAHPLWRCLAWQWRGWRSCWRGQACAAWCTLRGCERCRCSVVAAAVGGASCARGARTLCCSLGEGAEVCMTDGQTRADKSRRSMRLLFANDRASPLR